MRAKPIDRPKLPPGRPKTKLPETTTTDMQVKGIVNIPSQSDSIVEMTYCNITILKKLFNMYRNYECNEIEMEFQPEFLKMTCHDHFGRSIIYTYFYGVYMNSYYCREQVKICVKRESLEKIFNSPEKTQYHVQFILNEDYRSHLNIIIKDYIYNKESRYVIEVIHKPYSRLPDTPFDEQDYPLRFTLESKHFRSEINRIEKLSKSLTIQKVGGPYPLEFKYDETNRMVYSGIYKDLAKIKLKSTIEEEKIFYVSVILKYIKPFANAMLGDEIEVIAHPTQNICFIAQPDIRNGNVAVKIKVFTEIKSCNQQTIQTV